MKSNSVRMNKKINQLLCSGLKVVSVEMQGYRTTMEDQIICQLDLGDGNSLFAIFDGHKGGQISQFLRENFILYLKSNKSYNRGEYKKALREVFIEIDSFLFSSEGEERLEILKKQKIGCFSFTCSKILQKHKSIGNNVGSTANIVLITSEKIFVANAGDSRSTMLRKKTIIRLSQDHKPQKKEEKQRILKNGAYITPNNRINGQINVSRGFGDFRFKNKLKPPFERILSCVPDITEISRTKEDKFIIMGCDGFWEIEKCQRLADEVSSVFSGKKVMKQLIEKLNKKGSKIEEAVVEMFDENVALHKKEKGKVFDNMSAILIFFQ